MLRRAVVLLALVALLTATAVGCGSDRADRKPGPQDGSALDFTSRATIALSDSGFEPSTLTVKVGDTITVENRSSRRDGLSSKTIDVASHADPSRTGKIVVNPEP